MKRILTILLFVLPCFGQNTNPQVVITLIEPTNVATINGAVPLQSAVVYLNKPGAPIIQRVSSMADSLIVYGWQSSGFGVTGYNIYYGVASRQYTNSILVPKIASNSVSGLVPNTKYYTAATALAGGWESVLSNEMSTNTGTQIALYAPIIDRIR